VEKDPQAKQASMRNVVMLQQKYPHLLPTLAIQGYQDSLPKQHHLDGHAIFGQDWAN
jgi:hypothetical protein